MNDASFNVYESLCETSSPSYEVGEQNMVRCPFYDKPVDESNRLLSARYTKRTQRQRSTAQSRLGDMTVGDIRYCFQQLRNAGKNLSPDMMLYNGQSAGEFALKYLRETSAATRKRRKTLSMVVGRSAVADDKYGYGDRETDTAFGVNGNTLDMDCRSNVLEF